METQRHLARTADGRDIEYLTAGPEDGLPLVIHEGTPVGLSLNARLASAAAGRNLRAVLAWGRRAVRDAEARGEPWQLGIDAIRPHIREVWGGLSPADRRRFVRSVRPYWEVLRHRAPHDTLALVSAWQKRQRLEVVSGSVSSCRSGDDGLHVDVRLAGGARRSERYDAIVRCIGPALERAEADAPLVRDLIESGRAHADPAGLGISTDAAGRILRRDGTPDPGLFAIGALRRASSWETTSVPDIAAHALGIAKQIIP